MSPISDVMACTLKGNPRQAKRFLNTFLIRKSLSDIYYKRKDKIDYAVLAKLLALEYIDKELFKLLFKWSVANKQSEISELKTIIDIVNSSASFPEDYRRWSDEKIIRWVKAEPVNLHLKDLSPYFYLSRESLDINYGLTDTFTKNEREIFRNIKSAKAVLRNKLIKELNQNTDVKASKILDAFIDDFRSGSKNMLEIIQIIYVNYPEHRDEIKDIIKKYKDTDIKVQEATILNNMYRSAPIDFDDVIHALRKNKVNEKSLDVIQKIPESAGIAKSVPRKQ